MEETETVEDLEIGKLEIIMEEAKEEFRDTEWYPEEGKSMEDRSLERIQFTVPLRCTIW